MESQSTEERRHSDTRLLRIEDKIIDQDKAITTLTGTHQQLSYVLTNMQESLTEISRTLKKLADIEKQLVRYEVIEKDVTSKIATLQKVQEETGCSSMRNIDKRVIKLEENINKVVWGLLLAVGYEVLRTIGIGK
jgi:hypothetical protein